MWIRKLLKNRIVKNASWLIVGKLINIALSLVVNLISARYLGPSNFGLINYAAAYTTFFTSLCTLGINSIIIKNFVDNPDEIGETLGSAIVMRMASCLTSSLMIFGLTMIIDRSDPLTVTVVALCSIGLAFQAADSINYWFQYRLESKFTAIATLIAYLFMSVYKIILLILNGSVKWFALSNSVDYFVIALVLFLFYKKRGGPRFSFSLRKSKQLISASYHFIISSLMVAIYSSTDKFMLKQMLTNESVGYYSTAIQISTMWVFVLTAIIDSMYPPIMEAFKADKEQFDKRNKQLYAIVFYVSIAVSVMMCIFARPIVLILYGESYAGAIVPLRVITWYVAFSYLGVARNAWIVSYEKQKYLKYIYIASAGINVAFNFLLIPPLGEAGAATASLITQIATVFLVPLCFKELRANTKLMFDAVLLKGILPQKERLPQQNKE